MQMNREAGACNKVTKKVRNLIYHIVTVGSINGEHSLVGILKYFYCIKTKYNANQSNRKVNNSKTLCHE